MWAEAWTLPELGSFAMKRAIPGVIKVRDVHSGIGRGEVSIPADWPQIDAILAATEGSLIRVVKRGSDGGRNVVFEFTPEGASKEYTEDNEAVWRFTGPSIEAKLDQAIVLPYDYPTNPSVDPDWVYGFTNLIDGANAGFEDNPQSLVNPDAEFGSTFGWPTTGDRWDQIAPETFEAKTGAGADTGDWYFEVTGDLGEGIYQNFDPPLVEGKTYTVTARLYVATGDTTRIEVTPAASVSVGSLFNGAAYADAVGNDAYQTVTVTFVAGSGSGGISILSQTASNTWRVDNVTVSGFGGGLEDWGQRGTNGTFQVSSSTVRTGSYALNWKPTSGTAGNDSIYLPVRTTVGQQVTGSIWVYHTEGVTETFRLVLRIPGVNPNTQNVASVAVEVPTATWTQLVASGTATTAITELELRYDETGAPTNSFFVDDAEFYTGQAPATVGEILGDLHDDVTTDHTAESNDFDVDQLSWLKLDFSDTVDTNGDAWDDDIAISIPALLTFGQLMDRLARLGYEWRIVPNPDFPDTDTESHLLQVTNPWDATAYTGGLGSDKTSTVTITSGQAVLAGPVKRSELTRTVALAMDSAGNLAVSRDATGETNWGQRFAGARERHNYDDSLQQVADQLIVDRAQPVTASQVELIQSTQKPYLDFEPGDTVTFGLPPDLAQAPHRIATFTYDIIDSDIMWKVDFDRAVYTGLAGTVQAVNQLLRRAADPERDTTTVVSPETGDGVDGPIEITYLVAASDARPELKAQADFVCGGSDDEEEINAALAARSTARVMLSEGKFYIADEASITIGATQVLEGAGITATWIVPQGDCTFTVNGLMRDIKIEGEGC